MAEAVVHLLRNRGRVGTECCNLLRHQLGQNDTVTRNPEKATCEVTLPQLVNPIVDREASLNKRVKEAFPRLMEARARIDGASPSDISDDFRRQLLELIDRGQNAHT